MEITRYHNKKEMALSKKNFFISILLVAFMVIVFYFKETFVLDGVHNYHLYLIGLNFLAIVFVFTSPYMLYFDTFKGKLNITDDSYSFEDELNMFNFKISRSDIKNIDFIGNKVILKLKNNKTYSFEVKNSDDLNNIFL